MVVGSDTMRVAATFLISKSPARRTLQRSARSSGRSFRLPRAPLSKYWLEAAVVMPDHVHLICTPYELRLWMLLQAIKGSSSHRIKYILSPPIWQDESFDHILRSGESARTKAEYIINNPARKGLVATVDEWPWLWRSW